MQCKEIHKKEKQSKRWKPKSYLFGRDFRLVYNDKDITISILKTYHQNKELSVQKVKVLDLLMFLQIDGDQNHFLYAYQLLLCHPVKIPSFPFKSIETLHWNSSEFVENISECLLEMME